MTKKKEFIYCLYSNKEQERLLAMAYNEDEIFEESQYFTSGVWFQYEHIDDRFLINEKIYKKNIEFPEIPKAMIGYRSNADDYKWI